MLKAVLISLAAGGVATSLFEYFFKYNLVGLVVGIFKKGETAVKTEVKKL